jgi:SAM-dependent methyltransferase
MRVRNLVGRLHRRGLPPALTVLEQMDRMIEVRLVALAVEAGLVDAVARGPRTADQIASTADTDPDATFRVLRYLASKGWYEVPDRGPATPASRFGLTPAGSLLRTDHPAGLADWARFAGAPWMATIWNQAGESLRTGRSATKAATGCEFFDFLVGDAEAENLFDAAMAAGSGLQSELLTRSYDFSGHRRICDVGGGTGTTLVAVLDGAPLARGVLFERPSVIERARVHLESQTTRVELVAGDMFESVPDGCDLYLLLAIVHDWDDEPATRVLRHVADRLGPDGRALVVEAVAPDRPEADFSFMSDVLMLVLTGSGRERTLDQFHRLFADAGLGVSRDVLLPNLFHAFELQRA